MFRFRTADNRVIDACGVSAALRMLAVAVIAILAVLSSAGADAAERTQRFKGKNLFGITLGGDFAGQSADNQQRDLDAIKTVGARWIRIDINWAQVQAGRAHELRVGPLSTSVVREAQARGIKVLGAIDLHAELGAAGPAPAPPTAPTRRPTRPSPQGGRALRADGRARL